MATRNLTKAFETCRENEVRRRRGRSRESEKNEMRTEAIDADDTRELLSRTAHPSDAMRPLWMDIRYDVECDFRDVQDSMSALRKAQDSLLKDVMGNQSDRLNAEIDRLSADIPGSVRKVHTKIRRIAQTDGLLQGSEEAKIRKAITVELALRTQGIMKEFRACKRQFMERLKTIRKGGEDDPIDSMMSTIMTDVAIDVSDTKHSFAGDIDDDDTLSPRRRRRMKLQRQTQRRRGDDAEHAWLLERDKDVAKIAKSITDLSDMFQDVSVMIIEQGTILDRIDYNMESVVDTTKKGVLELEKAEEHQKSDRAIKCIAILVCLIIVLSIIYIAKKW